MTLLVQTPETRIHERRYVLDTVLSEWLGLEYDLGFHSEPHVSIRLAAAPEHPELTLPDRFLSTPDHDWLTERALPARPLKRIPSDAAIGSRPAWGSVIDGQPESIPILFSQPSDESLWRATPSGSALSLDVFGSVFFLLSRYEEVVRSTRDPHGRFLAAGSIAESEEFVELPLADEYVEVLWTAMSSLWPRLKRRTSAFRLRLTHDVDRPWSAFRQPLRNIAFGLGGDLLKRRDPVLAAQRIRAIRDARVGRVDRDPLNTFEFLLDVADGHALRSTFYFLAGNRPGEPDYRYPIDDPRIVRLIQQIHLRGHDIGLHASYVSHGSAERTASEFSALRSVCHAAGVDQLSWGVRQHFLRFEVPDSWRIQDSSGFEHDSTVGFPDSTGFRAGTCREFPVFDLLERRRLTLRERPLIAMDTSLVEYVGLSPDDAAARVRTIVNACRRRQGDAVLLFHNNLLLGTRLQGQYRELIDDLAQGP